MSCLCLDTLCPLPRSGTSSGMRRKLRNTWSSFMQLGMNCSFSLLSMFEVACRLYPKSGHWPTLQTKLLFFVFPKGQHTGVKGRLTWPGAKHEVRQACVPFAQAARSIRVKIWLRRANLFGGRMGHGAPHFPASRALGRLRFMCPF